MPSFPIPHSSFGGSAMRKSPLHVLSRGSAGFYWPLDALDLIPATTIWTTRQMVALDLDPVWQNLALSNVTSGGRLQPGKLRQAIQFAPDISGNAFVHLSAPFDYADV